MIATGDQVSTFAIRLLILEIETSLHLKRELTTLGHAVHTTPDVEELLLPPADPDVPSATVIVSDDRHRKDLRSIVADTALDASRPVIVVAPELGEADRLGLLRGGAIAIIENTYSVREIALRIHRLLDLRAPEAETVATERQTWLYGKHKLVIDENAHKVFLDDRYIRLTETEWRLLHYLASRWDAICAREAIIHESMGYSDAYPYLRSLDAHVKNLRKKLDNPGWIETVRGYGYQFMGQHKH
jgi:DNA-binding response OmpR family regulator